MILHCLIVGDSIGVGTADALAAQGVRCEVHARVGAPSAEPLQTLPHGSPSIFALIALGSNDPSNPALARNLLAVRRRVSAYRVTWLAPYNLSAARVVVSLARALGDDVVQLASYSTRDQLHPASYRQVAASLGWKAAGVTLRWPTPIAKELPGHSLAAPPVRRTVVLSFP